MLPIFDSYLNDNYLWLKIIIQWNSSVYSIIMFDIIDINNIDNTNKGIYILIHINLLRFIC